MKKLVAEVNVQKNSTPSSATFRGQSFYVMDSEKAGRVVNSLKRKYKFYSEEHLSHTYYQFWAVK